MAKAWTPFDAMVHCRIGSLEIVIAVVEHLGLGSLPYRQLRKRRAWIVVADLGSLPYRQLRNRRP